MSTHKWVIDVGLDIVELIMRLEEEFEIEITDEEASSLETVGLIYRCVISKLHLLSDDFDAFLPQNNTEEQKTVWEKVCSVTADELSVPRELIKPESHLVRDLGAD